MLLRGDIVMNNKTLVVIINGKGGVGKDTLCDFAKEAYNAESYSSIDPVKEVARHAGWNGEKTPEARRFLAKLKKIMIEYNDAPTKYLLEKYETFKNNGSNSRVMFCHIREAEEMNKLKTRLKENDENSNCIALLIRRDTGVESWGNASDDNVENYNYDYIYDNNLSLEETKSEFIRFLGEILG